MPHIRRCDDPTLLPFARSCLKKLRATGLEHAVQTFDAGTARVQVEIHGKHEYINIEGGSSVIPMDSGVVDLGAIQGDVDAWGQVEGVMYPAGDAIPYYGTYAQEGDSTTRTNPAKRSSGQIAGVVELNGRFQGSLPLAGEGGSWVSDAFKAARKKDESGKLTSERVELDARLALKKNTVLGCPASVFTGKCRLYVQAMYGLHLHSDRVPDGEDTLFYSLLGQTGVPPALKIKTRNNKGWDGKPDPLYQGQGDVVIDTNAGIWLDPTTGRHWLFAPNGHIYRMESSEAGEKWRRYLIPAAAAKLGLSDADATRLEAYILALSRPTGSGLRPTGATPNTHASVFGMGYGWHWAWSTPDAVCISTGSVLGTPPAETRTSVRKDLSAALLRTEKEDGTVEIDWSVTYTEGPPIPWALRRQEYGIFAPNWVDGLDKIPPRFTSDAAHSAVPFYAYYAVDKLVVCSTSSSFDNGYYNRAMVPRYFLVGLTEQERDTPGVYGPRSYMTYGTEGGHVTDTYGAGFWTARFSIDAFDSPELCRPHTVQRISDTLMKSGGEVEWRFYGSTAYADAGAYFFRGSDTIADPLTQVFYSGRMYVHRRDEGYYSFSIFQDTATTIYRSGAHCIIPFYDAQAVYFGYSLAENETLARLSGSATLNAGTTIGDSWTKADYLAYVPESGPQGPWQQLVFHAGKEVGIGSVAPTTNTNTVTDTETDNKKFAFFGDAKTDVDSLLNIGAYDLDTADTVPLMFATQSGAISPISGEGPSVALAPSIRGPIGFPQAESLSGNFALVGWV